MYRKEAGNLQIKLDKLIADPPEEEWTVKNTVNALSVLFVIVRAVDASLSATCFRNPSG